MEKIKLPISDLKSYSLITLTLPANYGYCIFVAVGSMFAVEWKSKMVEQARKTYNVPYPIVHSDKYEEFNDIQKSYQKTLQRYPQFLGLLLLGGLDSPVVSAAGGTIFILGRIASVMGYCNGDMKKKVVCGFGCVGWLVMMASTTKLALRLLQVI